MSQESKQARIFLCDLRIVLQYRYTQKFIDKIPEQYPLPVLVLTIKKEYYQGLKDCVERIQHTPATSLPLLIDTNEKNKGILIVKINTIIGTEYLETYKKGLLQRDFGIPRHQQPATPIANPAPIPLPVSNKPPITTLEDMHSEAAKDTDTLAQKSVETFRLFLKAVGIRIPRDYSTFTIIETDSTGHTVRMYYKDEHQKERMEEFLTYANILLVQRGRSTRATHCYLANNTDYTMFIHDDLLVKAKSTFTQKASTLGKKADVVVMPQPTAQPILAPVSTPQTMNSRVDALFMIFDVLTEAEQEKFINRLPIPKPHPMTILQPQINGIDIDLLQKLIEGMQKRGMGGLALYGDSKLDPKNGLILKYITLDELLN